MALFKKSTKAKDPQAFDALELARTAVLADAGDSALVGEFISVDFDDEDRIASYMFEAFLQGYKGWRWVVTVAKIDTDSDATVCDVVVLPGPDALLAPEWIPYIDRIQPGLGIFFFCYKIVMNNLWKFLLIFDLKKSCINL